MTEQISPHNHETHPYYAKVDGGEDRGFDKIKVGIYNANNEKIGEYERNYGLMKTFFPFEADGKWYALYSSNYTATRVMTLPDCKDISGEKPKESGFCPVEYYVPYRNVGLDSVFEKVVDKHAKRLGTKDCKDVFNDPDYKAEMEELEKQFPDDDETRVIEATPTIGFVSGCVWGDDNSWKIQHLDLSKVAKGKIKRDDRYGYIELPENMTLEESIRRITRYALSKTYIEFVLTQTYALEGNTAERS